ncbi:MAG TPA: ABC transporter ATP-binding protein [Acidimicrobiaceae bacterium]|nr:ABC transporter ATP-binding protein [Acidimicrobiaceae bacterium]|tara:strand:- start:2662 stop:3747 length:1086 start_codon:yes stop_codon:yes gene_type:complete
MLDAKHDGVLSTTGVLDVEADGVGVMNAVVDIGKARILDDVSVSAPKGSCLVILGPSGCGKTTLLRAIAGLQPISDGKIFLCGQEVSGSQVEIPPEQRDVGMVFQDWALFPHLTVYENVVFGLPKAQRKDPSDDVGELLEMVGISLLADRYPSSLSGGEQQRVALARSLAPKPATILLDEPFSSLDTGLRGELRQEVSDLFKQLGVTSIFVTHDQDEAFALGNQVAVMNDGRIIQQGKPAYLYQHPTDRWVANFVGEACTIKGDAMGSVAETRLGSINLCLEMQGEVDVLIRPEEILIEDGNDAEIIAIDFFGHDTLYTFTTTNDSKVLQCRTGGMPRYSVGDRVSIKHSGVQTVAFPVGS